MPLLGHVPLWASWTAYGFTKLSCFPNTPTRIRVMGTTISTQMKIDFILFNKMGAEVKGEASSCMLMMHPDSNISSLPAKSSSMEESYKSEEENELRPTKEITVSFGARDEGMRSESKGLHMSMSCRSFEDLEMEEVKGFMDLGFIFEKEHLNRQMISVIPGLQRLGLVEDGNHEDEGEEKGNPSIEGGRIRPYLSEAWLVRGPDSPLLNLWVLRKVDAEADMKKLLQHWAKSVASSIQRQS